MDTAPDTTSFAYEGLAEVDAEWLKQAAASLRLRLRNTVKDMLELGSMLTKARRRLEKKWNAWLKEEAQISQRSANRLLAVAQVFEKVPHEVLNRFTPTALYNLSEVGVPQSLREYCVEQATDGEQITAKVVDEWLGAYRENPKAPLKLASKDAPIAVDADEVYAGKNWLMLDKLVGNDGSIHIAASCDTEEQIGDRTIIGIYTNLRGERRTATHSSMERVLLTLCGTIRTKACRKCKETKPLDEFSRRANSIDGKNNYCAGCERKRVRSYERKKRAEAKAATAQTAQPAAA